jgi:hypothetical protein
MICFFAVPARGAIHGGDHGNIGIRRAITCPYVVQVTDAGRLIWYPVFNSRRERAQPAREEQPNGSAGQEKKEANDVYQFTRIWKGVPR